MRDGLKVRHLRADGRGAREAARVPCRRVRAAAGLPPRAGPPAAGGHREEHLHDWRGEATAAARASPTSGPRYSTVPCEVGRHPGHAGLALRQPRQRGLGPDREAGAGDFLPIVDGGFALAVQPAVGVPRGQGHGRSFCQRDVTGRTEIDPAAEALARNVIALRPRLWRPRRDARCALRRRPGGAAPPSRRRGSAWRRTRAARTGHRAKSRSAQGGGQLRPHAGFGDRGVREGRRPRARPRAERRDERLPAVLGADQGRGAHRRPLRRLRARLAAGGGESGGRTRPATRAACPSSAAAIRGRAARRPTATSSSASSRPGSSTKKLGHR